MSEKATTNYRSLRLRLYERGINLRQFALKRGHPVSTVYAAARRPGMGVRAQQIHRELMEAAHA